MFGKLAEYDWKESIYGIRYKPRLSRINWRSKSDHRLTLAKHLRFYAEVSARESLSFLEKVKISSRDKSMGETGTAPSSKTPSNE